MLQMALFVSFLALCSFLPLQSQAQGNCGCDPTTNLIPEGDFEISGNSLPLAYSTSLNHLCSCNYPDGTAGYGSYCIETTGYQKCTSFDPTTDHTTGSGKYMVVDGFPNSDPPTAVDPNIVWKYGVNIASAGTYEFSFWWYPNMSSSTNVLPEFDFRVNYVPVVSGIGGAGATTDQWNEFCTSYNFPSAGFYVIEIGQTNTGDFTNDYGIDDIFLGHCCECDVNANFTYTQTGPTTMDFTSTTTTSSCTSPVWYEWDFGDGNSADGAALSNVSHTYAGPGTYSVQLAVWGLSDTGFECYDKIKMEVKVEEQQVECKVSAGLTILSNSSLINLFNNSFDPIDIDHWTYTIYDPYIPPYVSFSGSVPSGTDASTHPDWHMDYIPSGPGWYYICLTVYDLDYPPPFECWDTVCEWVYIKEDPTGVPCDVVAGFNTTFVSGSTYAFSNTSTASSPLNHYWSVSILGGGTIHTANTPNLNYAFPGNGTYVVCLTEYQFDAPGECFDTHCDTITVTDFENYLSFGLSYDCNDPEPTMYISYLFTNGYPITITTSCSAPAVTTPGANATHTTPLSPMPYPIANEPPLTYSTCTVNILDNNGLSVTHSMYFNCQACPGTEKIAGLGDTPTEPGKPKDSFSQPKLSVFPNPTGEGEVQVRLEDLPGVTTVELIDVNGKVLQVIKLDVKFRNVQFPLSTSDLPTGIYFLRVQADTEILVEKLIVE